MTSAAEQQKNNEAHLAAAFEWLHLLLLSLVPPDTSEPLVEFERPPEPEPGEFVAARNDALEGRITEAREQMETAAAAEPHPAFITLCRQLNLSKFEQEILLLCAAFELDMRVAGLCARVQDDAGKRFPTFALALALFDTPDWSALSPQCPLRYLHLIEVNQPPTQPLMTSALRVDERVLNFIKGLNQFDDRLMPLLARVPPQDIELPGSQKEVAARILHALGPSGECIGGGNCPLIELTGANTASKRLIALNVAFARERPLYRLAADMLPSNAAELELFIRLWQRELLLKPVALYIDARELDLENQPAPSLQRFISICRDLTFLDSQSAWRGSGDQVEVFDIANPTPVEQAGAWVARLDSPDDTESDVETKFLGARLANQFDLDLGTIDRVAAGSLAEVTAEKGITDVVWTHCLATTRPRLDKLAQRIDTKATWEQIVLPPEASKLLDEIAEQVMQRGRVYDDWGFRERMNRGLGISALFSGESGTGKTMAAEVIANELDLNLYRIDLSTVVSKYIGETEKNLRRLFDAAEEGGAILFFDEADALFGKRSEVRDSHDRYANIEINYLLQRLESYRGLSILATNMKSSLDTAFMRRLRFVVDFPFPARTERAKIWQKVFPADAPVDERLDYERLAAFNLSGGSIHNIALAAAFRATSTEPAAITTGLIFDSIRTEFNKLGLSINERDFVLPPTEEPKEEEALDKAGEDEEEVSVERIFE